MSPFWWMCYELSRIFSVQHVFVNELEDVMFLIPICPCPLQVTNIFCKYQRRMALHWFKGVCRVANPVNKLLNFALGDPDILIVVSPTSCVELLNVCCHCCNNRCRYSSMLIWAWCFPKRIFAQWYSQTCVYDFKLTISIWLMLLYPVSACVFEPKNAHHSGEIEHWHYYGCMRLLNTPTSERVSEIPRSFSLYASHTGDRSR